MREDALIKQQAPSFFEDLLQEDPSSVDGDAIQYFLDLVPRVLTLEENQKLLSPVTREEVKIATFALDADSSPGPDGFYGKFYQFCWERVKYTLRDKSGERVVRVSSY